MEFDDLITFVLLFAFFILPSILKGRGKKKKKVQVKKKRFSIFGKLGETVQNFVRELEKQAQEAKQKTGQEPQGSVWDNLAEPVGDEIDSALPREPDPVKTAVPEFYEPEHPFISPPKKTVPISEPMAKTETCTGLPEICGGLGGHRLQQAVVWSEILGKPVALRND